VIGRLQFKDPPDWSIPFTVFGSALFGAVNAVVTAFALGLSHALPLEGPSQTVEAVVVGLVFSLFFAFLNREVVISLGFGIINAGAVSIANILDFSAVIAVGVSNGLAVAAFMIFQIANARQRDHTDDGSGRSELTT
jgi:hypothetical protein